MKIDFRGLRVKWLSKSLYSVIIINDVFYKIVINNFVFNENLEVI